jgi:hypothetical protein
MQLKWLENTPTERNYQTCTWLLCLPNTGSWTRVDKFKTTIQHFPSVGKMSK